MNLFRIWLHDETGCPKRGHTDVQASCARTAAEQVYGASLAAFGPLQSLRVLVMQIGDATDRRRSDAFFAAPRRA